MRTNTMTTNNGYTPNGKMSNLISLTTLNEEVERLKREAYEKGMDYDLETMSLKPFSNLAPPPQWERGDNDPASPEEAGWDKE